MNGRITIGGIDLTMRFCRKINQDSVPVNYISSEPIINMYESDSRKSFVVNIVSCLPAKLKSLSKMVLHSGLFLDDDKNIFLGYAGVNNIKTAISTHENSGSTSCRVFNIIYDNKSLMNDYYDLYHIQFEYKLRAKNFQAVEAVIVYDINTDPETDRGTVTTVRVDDQ